LLRIQNTLETRKYYTRQVDRADLFEAEVAIRTEEIRQTQLEVVKRLGSAGEFRDNETGAHVKRMSQVCSLLSEKLGLEKSSSELLLYASTMHDIGKIGIPDGILLKPGKLSPEEWKIMRQHPKIGAQIIGNHPSE